MFCNNNSNDCATDVCIYCQLKQEYKEMIQDSVDWDKALHHILDTAFDYSDKQYADVIDENFSVGLAEGVLLGMRRSIKIMEAIYEDTEEELAVILDEETVLDDESELNEKDIIQQIIKDSL